MKTRKVAGTPADPTLPKTPITIGGTTYDLCFDLGALAEAEQALNREGHNVNLLAALPVMNLANVRVIFAAAIRKFHPEITFEQAMAMITLQNVYLIANAVSEAWQAALPEPEPVPTEAVTA
jgi:hypothetical protein